MLLNARKRFAVSPTARIDALDIARKFEGQDQSEPSLQQEEAPRTTHIPHLSMDWSSLTRCQGLKQLKPTAKIPDV